MFCLKGHDHTSIAVKVVRRNETHQPGPFHCGDCSHVSRSDRKEDDWGDIALWMAILEGRPRCGHCFP